MRETKNIKLPSGKIVEVFSFFTFGERQKINEVLFKDTFFSPNNPENVKFSAKNLFTSQKIAAEIILKTGKNDIKFDELGEEDGNFIVEYTNSISTPEKKKPK